MYDSFSKLVLKRQSCREFNDMQLEDGVIDKILNVAINAPSACNSQPWKIYVVTEQEKLVGVRKAIQDSGMNKFTDKAKAFIVLTEIDAEVKETVKTRFNRNHFVKYDIGELTAYITLTAESLGVKSCIIGWINQQILRQTVGYPEEEISNIVIALGYSDIPIRQKARKDKSKTVKYL